jgi:hypothetical protein
LTDAKPIEVDLIQRAKLSVEEVVDVPLALLSGEPVSPKLQVLSSATEPVVTAYRVRKPDGRGCG